ARTVEVIGDIGRDELMRFRIGHDGLTDRPDGPGTSAIAVIGDDDVRQLATDGSIGSALGAARARGAATGAIVLGSRQRIEDARAQLIAIDPACAIAPLAVPASGLLLDGVTRLALKMLLNASSTATMVRMGRVMGNFMIWVSPTNMKLIDRATRYVQKL